MKYCGENWIIDSTFGLLAKLGPCKHVIFTIEFSFANITGVFSDVMSIFFFFYQTAWPGLINKYWCTTSSFANWKSQSVVPFFSGYMAPEYVMHGQFSTKSDIYSFGVLVLEIVSGQKNSSFYESDRAQDLLSYVSIKNASLLNLEAKACTLMK